MEWPNLAEMKRNLNHFWEVLYKEYTEPHMSKYHKEQVFGKIKKKVFEGRSRQIKRAKEEGKTFKGGVKDPAVGMGSWTDLNAYNLDNNDLDYVVYKKYLMKLAELEKKILVEVESGKRKEFKRAKSKKRFSVSTAKVCRRLSGVKKRKKGLNFKKNKLWRLKTQNKVILTSRDRDITRKDYESRDEHQKKQVKHLDLGLGITRDQYFDYLLANDPTFLGFKKTQDGIDEVIHDMATQKSNESGRSQLKVNNFLTKTNKTDQEYEQEAILVQNNNTKSNNIKLKEDTEIPVDRTVSIFAEPTDETQRISFGPENSQIDLDIRNNKTLIKCNGLRNLKRKFRKRNVISALTRKTDSMSRTRPSTGRETLSKRTAKACPKENNFKSVSVITEKVRLKSGKRRPKTGKQLRSTNMLTTWTALVKPPKKRSNVKDLKTLNLCMKECDYNMNITKSEKKLINQAHNSLKEDLENQREAIEESKEVLKLSKKYIDSCVRQFRRDKRAFVYGKNPKTAHYIQDRGRGVYTTMERISKLNPKYINMVKEMKKRIDEEDNNLLLF
ncbi:unnamed protein product [Moneuplotes crassus]|uniref:Uncharacterized protein n=2 Tax=Euplotes crassus TaxID=5936 RepID=A0AAD1UFF9_EUPCR|nr:unnamed protein product [Moneuplotes crassus]